MPPQNDNGTLERSNRWNCGDDCGWDDNDAVVVSLGSELFVPPYTRKRPWITVVVVDNDGIILTLVLLVYSDAR
jgi:hypothetical protein